MTDGQGDEAVLQQIRDTGVDFSDTETKEGLRRIGSALATLRFTTTSECGMVTAIHNGASALVDIGIDDQALRIYDARQLASVVELTIRRGEGRTRELLRRAAGGSGGQPAW